MLVQADCMKIYSFGLRQEFISVGWYAQCSSPELYSFTSVSEVFCKYSTSEEDTVWLQ